MQEPDFCSCMACYRKIVGPSRLFVVGEGKGDGPVIGSVGHGCGVAVVIVGVVVYQDIFIFFFYVGPFGDIVL